MNATDDFRQQCRRTALILLLTLPLLRLVEAVGRLFFLPSYYNSFGEALIGEPWFSPVWWLYARATWFGWSISRLLSVWLVAIPVVLLLPTVTRPKAFCIAVAGVVLLGLEFLTHPIIEVRSTFGGDGRSNAELVWCFRSHSPEVRHQAALAHASFKFGMPPGTISVMRNAMRDKDPQVRQAAVNVLANHASVETMPELTEALEDEDRIVREQARWALDKMGKPAVYNRP